MSAHGDERSGSAPPDAFRASPGRPVVGLERVASDEREALAALVDRYLAELMRQRERPVGPVRASDYRYLPLYWQEAGRHPFFMTFGDERVGFVLFRHVAETGVFQMSDFYVGRRWRRRGVAREALDELWRRFPGAWELQVHVANERAIRFWERGIAAGSVGEIRRRPVVEEDGRRIQFDFVVGRGSHASDGVASSAPETGPGEYEIGLARGDELASLARIEAAAAERFPAGLLPPAARTETLARKVLEASLADGALFVARTRQHGTPVGFAAATRVRVQSAGVERIGVETGEGAHLHELDVLPAHGRRGLGRLLLRRVIDWAREEGLARVSLTTFRALAWNAPFYRSEGFRELAGTDLDAGLRTRLAEEAEQGLDPGTRVAMQLVLPAPGQP